MKISLKLFFFLLCTFFFGACEKNKGKIDSLTSTIAVDLNKSDKAGYSELFEDSDYLFLKPHNNQYIVYPEKIIKYEDKLYISTRDYNIFIYNLNGDFLNVIDSPGEGPGGIRKIDDFQVFNNQIIVKDGYLKKYLYFDLDGAFIREQKDLFSTANFYFGHDFKLLYPHNDPELGDFRVFKINEDNSVTGFLELGDYLKPRVYVQNGFKNVPNSDEVFIGLPVTFEIAYFNRKGELSQNVHLDLGENQVSAKDRAKFSSIQEEYLFLNTNKFVDSFTRIFPISENNFMFIVNRGEKYPNVVVCSREGKVIFNSNAFLDDTNNLQKVTIPWTFSEGKVISWNRMNTLYEDYISNSSINQDTKLELLFNKHSDYLDQEDIVLILSDIKKNFL